MPSRTRRGFITCLRLGCGRPVDYLARLTGARFQASDEVVEEPSSRPLPTASSSTRAARRACGPPCRGRASRAGRPRPSPAADDLLEPGGRGLVGPGSVMACSSHPRPVGERTATRRPRGPRRWCQGSPSAGRRPARSRAPASARIVRASASASASRLGPRRASSAAATALRSSTSARRPWRALELQPAPARRADLAHAVVQPSPLARDVLAGRARQPRERLRPLHHRAPPVDARRRAATTSRTRGMRRARRSAPRRPTTQAVRRPRRLWTASLRVSRAMPLARACSAPAPPTPRRGSGSSRTPRRHRRGACGRCGGRPTR